MVEQVPPGEPWPVACYNGDVMALGAWAIPLGGQVSIDLGDHHYNRFGTPTNADLVRRVAGRDPGTPRSYLGANPRAPGDGARLMTHRSRRH